MAMKDNKLVKEKIPLILNEQGGTQSSPFFDNSEKIKLKFLELWLHKETKPEATEVLVQYILENNFIGTTKNDLKSEIWFYDGGIYVPNGKSRIKEILRQILGETFSTHISNLVIAKIEADTFIDEQKFFTSHYDYIYEVPVRNGILNIKTRKLKPFNPKKWFFNKMPVEYNPKATCPAITKFLKDVLASKEDLNVFFEIGGFGLLKDYTYEKSFMFVGFGRNGKGKTIELLKRLFGPENCCSIPLSMLEPNSFDTFGLFGKMLNLAGDIGSSDLKDTSFFKSSTGRDLIAGKRKFLPTIYFVNYAKYIFACNELPMVWDTSKGFWDRWVLFNFPYTFEPKEVYEQEKNPFIKLRRERIIDEITTDEELSGLLNEFLNGFDRLEKNKSFSSTKGTEEIKNFWIRRANPFMAFCMDCLEESDNDKDYIFKDDLRKSFKKYCKRHKLTKGAGDKMIKATLQEMFGAGETQIRNVPLGDGWINPYAWKGIKLKS